MQCVGQATDESWSSCPAPSRGGSRYWLQGTALRAQVYHLASHPSLLGTKLLKFPRTSSETHTGLKRWSSCLSFWSSWDDRPVPQCPAGLTIPKQTSSISCVVSCACQRKRLVKESSKTVIKDGRDHSHELLFHLLSKLLPHYVSSQSGAQVLPEHVCHCRDRQADSSWQGQLCSHLVWGGRTQLHCFL